MPDKKKNEIRERNRRYQAEWYRRNRQTQILRSNETKKHKREWLCSLKEGKSCLMCSESHPATLDFHHRNPKEKDFGLGEAMNMSKAKVLAEMAKCDVLCANCHRKLHWEES